MRNIYITTKTFHINYLYFICHYITNVEPVAIGPNVMFPMSPFRKWETEMTYDLPGGRSSYLVVQRGHNGFITWEIDLDKGGFAQDLKIVRAGRFYYGKPLFNFTSLR